VSVNLSIQLANRMRHIVIFGLPGSALYFRSLIKDMISGGGVGRGVGKFFENKMCVLIVCTNFV